MKKLIALLSILLLVGCTTNPVEATPTPSTSSNTVGCDINSECSNDQADMSGYGDLLDESHVFYTMTYQNVIDAMNNKETFVVYFGFANCPWCIEMIPLLNETASNADVKVGYVNVRPDDTKENDTRNDDNPDYVEFRSLVEEILSENDEGKKVLYVPFVFFIKDGEVVAYNEATLPEHNAKEREMTEEEIETLTSIYAEGFEALK